MKKKIKISLIVFVWLCLWQLAAVGIDNDILLAGPVEVCGTFLKLLGEAEFYNICIASLLRIMLGFLAAFFTGIVFGVAFYRFPLIKDVMQPVIAVVKSIPVASFVVLLLIWQGADNLSVWISFLVVFPNACISTENGLRAVDMKLKEMADIFEMKGLQKLIYIYRPSVLAYLISGMEISIGMAFKSGAAAEIIGVPEFSIGERIYMSKIYLDTPGVFAWTLALILLSFAMEKLILAILKWCNRPVLFTVKDATSPDESAKAEKKVSENGEQVLLSPVCIQGICKSYENKKVLSNISYKIEPGECVLLMGESGFGKTTLLRILAGLEEADTGTVTERKVSYLFQEDRLLESEFTITNIMSTMKRENKDHLSLNKVETIMEEILPEECFYQKTATLSGGMKRRLSLIRTMLYRMNEKDCLLLLDEPFAGLDDETKQRTVEFIHKYKRGRTMIVATHDEEDAKLLGGKIWNIQKPELH